jgi:hypothetical protein
VHVPQPRRAHGERDGERDPLVALAGQRAEPDRDVHVGGAQHARLHERREQAAGQQRAAWIERIGLGDHRARSSAITARRPGRR